MKRNIAIKGYGGSFHDIAARNYFGQDTETIPCSSFRSLFKTVQEDHSVHAGIIAIENSIAGSLLPNYSLLQASHLAVTGEIYLPISHQLLSRPGARLKEIREVHSHPMALLQCAAYLEKQQWRQVEAEDTALAARMISESKMKHVAAIGSALAADMYHLQILDADIQTEKINYTRFLILQRELRPISEDLDKASVFFELSHQTGSLARVLSLIARSQINLSKLQSVPIPEIPWKYAFHADMEFDAIVDFQQAIDRMKESTEKLIIYGIYRRGNSFL